MSPVFRQSRHPSLARNPHQRGLSVRLRPTLSFETVGFYKKLYGLVSRSESPSPGVGESLTQDGIGRSYGVQALLRQELSHGFFGLDHLYPQPKRTPRPPGSGLASVGLRPDACAGILASYEIGPTASR